MPYRVDHQPDVVVVTVDAALTNGEFASLRATVASHMAAGAPAGLVVDVTPLDVVDSLAVRTFQELGRLARLRGAETVIVGIQPQVWAAMTQFGLTLRDVATAANVDEALGYLERTTKGKG
jgi:rsbT antagonist protein RsbS